MTSWTNRILLISVLWTLDGCSQATYDDRLVSHEKELNFAFTDKRGIEGDGDIIYYVEKDGQTLTAYNDGKIEWTVNIIKVCGEPAAGKPEIRYLRLTKEQIEITFGKHDFASVDTRNGKVNYLGAD